MKNCIDVEKLQAVIDILKYHRDTALGDLDRNSNIPDWLSDSSSVYDEYINYMREQKHYYSGVAYGLNIALDLLYQKIND